MISSSRFVSALCAAALLMAAAAAYGVGGTDNAGCYAFSDTIMPLDGNAPTYSFTDIAGTGTQIPLGDDQMSGAIPLGFTFNYYGIGYTDVFVSSNGFLTFLSGQDEGCCSGEPIPTAGDPDAIIAGWWEDLRPGINAGTVNYQTLGSPGSRVFIVQFGSVDHYPSGTPVTFEFKLFETSNEIEVHYANAVTDGDSDHSAGIENQDGSIGAQWQFGEPLSFSNTAVRYFASTGLSGDSDSDGVANCIDNCPTDPNPGQEDADSDGVGDDCDPCFGTGTIDTDSDGICDSDDPCPSDPTQSCLTIFACTGTGNSASDLYRISPLNGIGVLVGPMGIRGCGGLALHPTTEVLYAVGQDPNTFTPSLYTVDTSTGAATLVGPTGQSQASDIAFRSDGVLFSYHQSAGSAGTVSLSTGAVTLLGPSGLFQAGNGITFDQTDTLLHAGNTSLSSIDQTTGAGTGLAALAFPPVSCSFPRINSMDTSSSGTVFGVMNCTGGQNALNYLVTIGVPTGSVAAIAPTVPGLDGIAFGAGVCGDGMPGPGEDCDDGNTVGGDCCSATCTYEVAGSPCTDGNPCTADECDGAGNCVSAPPTGCLTPGKSLLYIKDSSDNGKDKLIWKWLKGPQTAQGDFGNPASTADYALCLYTGVGLTPLASAVVPADSMKWAPISTKGYKYRDSGGSAAGMTNIILKGGGAGQSKAQVKGKGASLPDPTLGNLPLPVTVQLVNSETNVCFKAAYDTADVKKNDAGQFKAKK